MKKRDGAEVILISMNLERVRARNKIKLNTKMCVSSTEESEVVKPSVNFPVVELKDYDIDEKTTYFVRITHIIEKPITRNTEAEKNRR